MKKISFALAAASALSLSLASTAQAGEGGIAAGAAATFDAGDLTSLSVAAAVGKESAAVAVRANVGNITLQEVATDGMGNPLEEGQDVVNGNPVPGSGTFVLVDVAGPGQATTEAYALGGSGDITVNSIAASEALNANNVAPNPVLEGGDDLNPGIAQANNIGDGGQSFVVFDPSTGDVVLVEGNAPN